MISEVIVFITSFLSLIAGGGWFIYWRLNRNMKESETALRRAEFYTKIIDDLELRVIKLQEKVKELEKQCDSCEFNPKTKKQ